MTCLTCGKGLLFLSPGKGLCSPWLSHSGDRRAGHDVGLRYIESVTLAMPSAPISIISLWVYFWFVDVEHPSAHHVGWFENVPRVHISIFVFRLIMWVLPATYGWLCLSCRKVNTSSLCLQISWSVLDVLLFFLSSLDVSILVLCLLLECKYKGQNFGDIGKDWSMATARSKSQLHQNQSASSLSVRALSKLGKYFCTCPVFISLHMGRQTTSCARHVCWSLWQTVGLTRALSTCNVKHLWIGESHVRDSDSRWNCSLHILKVNQAIRANKICCRPNCSACILCSRAMHELLESLGCRVHWALVSWPVSRTPMWKEGIDVLASVQDTSMRRRPRWTSSFVCQFHWTSCKCGGWKYAGEGSCLQRSS